MKIQAQKEKAMKLLSSTGDDHLDGAEQVSGDKAYEAIEDDCDMLNDLEEEDNKNEGDCEDNGDAMTSLGAFKKLVVETLEVNELSQKRAAKMECIDFLNLLSVLNAKGIHF